MNDVEKTNIERQNSGKRMRRRKRLMSIYTFVVVLLVLTFGVTLCMTFLFNIDEIVISGESEKYTYMEIVEASGIRAGDNLLRLDTEKAKKAIMDKLLYVETVNIDRDFPSTLRINVSRCIPAFNVQYEGGVLLVSGKGKILSDNDFYTDDLPIIYGFVPKEMSPGSMLETESKDSMAAFEQLVNRFQKDSGADIASIDLTDIYNIVVTYRNGMIFKMGNNNDVEYKLDLAKSVMEDDVVKGKKGYLTMIGSNQCSFRTNGEPAETTPALTTSAGTTTKPIDSAESALNTENETTTTAVQNTTEAATDQNSGWSGDDNGNTWDGGNTWDSGNTEDNGESLDSGSSWDDGSGNWDSGSSWDNGSENWDFGNSWDNGGANWDDNSGGWNDNGSWDSGDWNNGGYDDSQW